MSAKPVIYTVTVVIIIAALIAYPFVAVDPEGAYRVLANAGYKDIQTNGYAWFACDKNDFYATKFTAIGPNGQVSGAVCAGILKGNTIRFD